MAINYGAMEFFNKNFQSLDIEITSRYTRDQPETRETIDRLIKKGYEFDLFGGPIHYNPKSQSQMGKASAVVGDGLQYVSDILKFDYVFSSFGSKMSSSIRNSNLFLFNGGNLIHHSPHRGYLPYVLAIIYPLVVARRNDIPYALLPQTVFNLEGPYEAILISILDGAEFIWTRDDRTYEYLKQRESISTPIYKGLDIGFVGCHQYDKSNKDNSEGNQIAVVPRFSELGDTADIEKTDTSSVEKALKEYMKQVVNDGDSVTVVVQTNSEKEWVKNNISFLESIGVEIFESFDQDKLCSFYAKCDLLLTMRLHAGIFGLTQGTPTIGVYRDEWGPKIPGTWEALDISEYAKSWDEISVNTLHDVSSSALKQKDKLSKKILENIDDRTTEMTNKLEGDIKNILD